MNHSLIAEIIPKFGFMRIDDSIVDIIVNYVKYAGMHA